MIVAVAANISSCHVTSILFYSFYYTDYPYKDDPIYTRDMFIDVRNIAFFSERLETLLPQSVIKMHLKADCSYVDIL